MLCDWIAYQRYRDLRVRGARVPRNSRMSYACEGPVQKRKRALRRANRDGARRLGLVRKGDGTQVHHRNGNVFDNRPCNLQILTASAHRRLHRRQRRRFNV